MPTVVRLIMLDWVASSRIRPSIQALQQFTKVFLPIVPSFHFIPKLNLVLGNHFDAPGSTFNVTMVERESSPAIFNIHPAINKGKPNAVC